jgi:hypothetical protein
MLLVIYGLKTVSKSEKLKLLSIYQSHKDKEYLQRNAIFGLAQYRAYQSCIKGIKFAEAFQVTKLEPFNNKISLI